MPTAIRYLLQCIVMALVLTGCDMWGSIDDAENLYLKNKQEFQRIYVLIDKNKELKNISSTYDPYKDENIVSKYGAFNDQTKAAYANILEIMGKFDLKRIRIERFKIENTQEVEIVKFLVFARGIGGSTEGVEIIHFREGGSLEKFTSPSTICRQIDGPHWFACYFK